MTEEINTPVDLTLTRDQLRAQVRGLYDIQQLRIQIGNRITANFRAKMGLNSSEKEEDAEKEDMKLIKKLRDSYRTLTDGDARLPTSTKFKGDGVIDSYAELCLLDSFVALEHDEGKMSRQLEPTLKLFPIYTEFLEGVRGCGPAMSAIIISEIDIHASKYASSIWKLAGLDVTRVTNKDGQEVMEGRSKRANHLIDREYTTAEGKQATRKSITYNPRLKTKLVGVLAACFLRSKSPYAEVYANYKNRIENMPAHADKTPMHRHRMALRYMIKQFLADL
jgi:hypothetical protein